MTYAAPAVEAMPTMASLPTAPSMIAYPTLNTGPFQFYPETGKSAPAYSKGAEKHPVHDVKTRDTKVKGKTAK